MENEMMEFSPCWGFSSDHSKKRQLEKHEETDDSEDSSQEKTAAQSLITKTLKGKLKEAWVQCEKPDCLKWRSISKSKAKSLGDEPWFCHMNENLGYSSCNVAEEDTLEAEEMAERCRLVYIRSILPGGSLVWAKMPGYCWWPGFVVVDVDYGGISVAVDCDGDPLSYHIEFLGPKRSHAWIPEHMVEIYGEHVPFDPSAGRQEKTSGLERTIFKGFSVKEAVKEATSFQTLTLMERLSRSHFLSSAPVGGSSKPRRDNRKGKVRQRSGLDSSKNAVHCITAGLDEQVGSQCDVKKKRQKAEGTAIGKKLSKKNAAKEKGCSDGEPVTKIPKLKHVQKSEKPCNRSGDQLPLEEKSKCDGTASVEDEQNSSVARNIVEDSELCDSRVVPDIDDEIVQKPSNEGSAVQKMDVSKTSKLKAGKPSFMVPSSGSSSKPMDNKANNGPKKGFCPPVKTKTQQNSSAADLNRQLKPKSAAKEETRPTTTFTEDDEIVENDGERVGEKGRSCSGELNEAESSGAEQAEAFDELADEEVCSVAAAAQEEGQGLQQLLHQSASLVGRTKEEKYTIDVQTYKENRDRFEGDVRKFMSVNKQRSQKLPVWENRCIGLWELFLAVHERGGYDTVCQKRLWTEIYSELTGISTAKRNSKTKNYYTRYLLPYELHINGREYEHLFTKAVGTGEEPKKAKKPSKSSGKTEDKIEDKTSIKKKKKLSKTSDVDREEREDELQPDDGDDAEDESAELEQLMLDLKEYDTLCQSQVSACLQHDATSNPTTPKKKLTSTPARKPLADSFLCDVEERLLNDDDDAHVVPLACTLSPVFSSDCEESCELQELEALKHELISMQQHLDEMNNSLL